VLDGYPLTKTQMMLLEQRNIIPVCVIELEVDARDCADRATADRYSKDRLASDTFWAFPSQFPIVLVPHPIAVCTTTSAQRCAKTSVSTEAEFVPDL